MEFKIIEQKVGAIVFNFEEMNKELDENLKSYKGLVVVEESLKEAKETRAKLNKVATTIDNERKKIKKQYEAPLKEFEDQVKLLVGKVKEVTNEIDVQVKAFEDKNKEAKVQEIKYYFNAVNTHEWLSFEEVFNEKWTNLTTSMKSIKDEIDDIVQNHTNNILNLKNVYQGKDLEDALFDYQKIKDLNAVISNITAKKSFLQSQTKVEEEETIPAVCLSEEIKPTVDEQEENYILKIRCTKAQKDLLKEFIIQNGIKIL